MPSGSFPHAENVTGQAPVAAAGTRSALGYALALLVKWSALLWVGSAVALALGLLWIGEKNSLLAFLLYLPPALWLLPALFLAPLAALFHRRSLLLLAACTGASLLWWGGRPAIRLALRANPPSRAGSETLVVMTLNDGQRGRENCESFVRELNPDVVCLQESGRPRLNAALAEFPHSSAIGEHSILSRLPILNAKPVPARPGGSSRAARVELEWQGRSIAVYSVHLTSPRGSLGGGLIHALNVGGMLDEVTGGRIRTKRSSANFWDNQVADAEHLLDFIRRDPLPAIVAGDFNAPHTGWISHRLRQVLVDSHVEAGRGFGLTFPGTSRNPLSFGGPWLRIDYVFHTSAWKAQACFTEPNRPSQHRAVAALLNFDRDR